MRKYLHFTILFLFASFTMQAQITFPVVRANFGVEADLSANFFNNTTQPAVDDWFSNGLTGTGRGVIDTAGAAALLAGYTSNPASRKNAFSRLMAVPAYTLVNNRLLLDAVYHRDYHGTDSTAFSGGSNKNGTSPGIWTAAGAQAVPDKNDILDAMVHVRRAGPNASDSLWMFTGLSLENTTGNRFFDFELYQTDITYDKATGMFTGHGPKEGHNEWEFDAAGNITKPGDIIFTAEFGSSSLSLVVARIWVKRTTLTITPATFNWGGLIDGASNSSLYGYANIIPKTVGAFYTGLQNNGFSSWAGSFGLIRGDDALVTNYIPNQFMEFAVNLTKLGIEPADFSNNLCGSPFRRVLIKSRSSTSFTSVLKDFVAPFRLFNYADVDANTNLTYFCGTMPTTSIFVQNPNVTSVYQWSTINGNIVGSTSGTSITVNAPGTYYVMQQLHPQCPSFSTDSVTILFEPVCSVLENKILELKADQVGNNNRVSWSSSHNEEISRYDIEYSFNGSSFVPLGQMNAKNQPGRVGYEITHAANSINSPVVFYRIIAISKTGEAKYSNVVSLRRDVLVNNAPIIFPNPVKMNSWISYQSTKAERGTVVVFDPMGKMVTSKTINLVNGENVIPLPSATGFANGTYIVQLRTGSHVFPMRMVVQR